ncbi:uncharacterized protein E5676_scaffold606G00130 [Cucumis melo var. makuwa]|uniref:DUF4216 domain-containing protein n=1 Tax=Cucumis melo var. makuwa TaxID=1194695 RepID=A0A5D3C761_CUCMM|nr:uncharacterized protein E5676_scaffold606G00130 [Cucumis melo var. makuwa]
MDIHRWLIFSISSSNSFTTISKQSTFCILAALFLTTTLFTCPLRCDWVDTKNGVRVDDLGFTLVDLNRIGHYLDSFILASQARQVFYVKDPNDGRSSVVVKPQEKDFVDICYNDELGDTSLHYPAILECPADMTREDEEIPYIRVDCEGTWGTFNSKLEDLLVVFNSPLGKGTRGPTGMSEITRVSCDGHKRVVEYNELGQPIGESATKLKSFIGTTVRGGFVVDPRSKKSILQNANVYFRNFKSSLTTKHVLPYRKDLEKLKDPPTEYSFIDREHWNIFVASRLTEQFEMVSNKGRERRKNNKYNHQMSQKGYANLAEEIKASTSNGKLIDCALVWKKARTIKNGEIPAIDTKEVANKIVRRIRGVGKYVTPSKYFLTAREKRKKVGKEEDYAEERARMAARILKLEAELMKHKRVPEVVTKGETYESKI